MTTIESNTNKSHTKKPKLILTLSIIQMIFGIFYTIRTFSSLFYFSMINPDFHRALPNFWGIYFVILILGSSIGLWKGRIWGWWCTSLLYMGLAAKTLFQLIVGLQILSLKVRTEDIYILNDNYLIIIGFFFIYLIILVFLFHKKNLEYFKLIDVKKVKVLSILFLCSFLYFMTGQLLMQI